MPPFLSEHLRPVRLDSPAVRTLHVPAYGACRRVREVLLDPLQPERDVLRRLVVHEVRLDELPKVGIEGDRLADRPAVLPPHV